jgi:hypothetical protein
VTASPGPATTMWEVVAAESRLDELLAWVRARVAGSAQLYRSVDDELRVVVIDPTGQAATSLAGCPTELVSRPAHAWDFQLL